MWVPLFSSFTSILPQKPLDSLAGHEILLSFNEQSSIDILLLQV